MGWSYLYVGDAGNTSLVELAPLWARPRSLHQGVLVIYFVGVLHPGVPVMWYGHIRICLPQLRAVWEAVCPM